MHPCIVSPKRRFVVIDDPWLFIRYNQNDLCVFFCTTIIVHTHFLLHPEMLISVVLLINWVALSILYCALSSCLIVSSFHLITMIRRERWKWGKKRSGKKIPKCIYESLRERAATTGSRLTKWRRPDIDRDATQVRIRVWPRWASFTATVRCAL